MALYLNFDMVGSPNFVRFVYDGATQPPGSDVIEDLFGAFWDSQSLPFELVEVGGRSDHFAFAAFGVPIRGLFTGAEVIKTPEQAAIYGGVAGEQFDQCYHLACDTFDNVSLEALDQMTDATAFAILTYSMNTESVNGVSGKGNLKQQNQLKPLDLDRARPDISVRGSHAPTVPPQRSTPVLDRGLRLAPRSPGYGSMAADPTKSSPRHHAGS